MPSIFRYSSTDTHQNPMDPSISSSLTSPEDISLIIQDLQKGNSEYKKIIEKLSKHQLSSYKTIHSQVSNEDMELLRQRDAIKASFIARKQAVRSLLKLLASSSSTSSTVTNVNSSTTGSAALPSSIQQIIQHNEQILSHLQAEFRQCDAEFKNLNIASQRQSSILITPSISTPNISVGNTKQNNYTTTNNNNNISIKKEITNKPLNNNDLLDSTLNTHTKTHETLKDALVTVAETKVIGTETVIKLEEDREKLSRIDHQLNTVQSELDISRLLLIRIFKRLYTDRVIIALATLCVLGLLGIIIYASIKPDQTTFRVPDEVLPPLKKE